MWHVIVAAYGFFWHQFSYQADNLVIMNFGKGKPTKVIKARVGNYPLLMKCLFGLVSDLNDHRYIPGAVWAKQSWGRYWGWDLKNLGINYSGDLCDRLAHADDKGM